MRIITFRCVMRSEWGKEHHNKLSWLMYTAHIPNRFINLYGFHLFGIGERCGCYWFWFVLQDRVQEITRAD